MYERILLWPTRSNRAPSICLEKLNTMFLWIVVVMMALALVAQVVSLLGMALLTAAAARRATLMKAEISKELSPSVRVIRDLTRSLRPEVEKFRGDAAEITTILSRQFRAARVVWQDANRRKERLLLRFSREGVASVQQLQRDRHIVRQGVLKPIREAASVALGVSATTWLLRRVA